ncbi:ABC transporter substrate-binding protein [Paenibacillus caui]|uniref:ABC transporter substrate-binding protein n=1 Tax=Paenibacillus caui TaxID=2873927 RepID=UPI001CA84264|nr:ABC transporter substrate-binding protein [Paenibacillus caui]
MMKKKSMLICAILVLIVTVLSACSGKNSESSGQASPSQSNQPGEQKASVTPPSSLAKKGVLTYATAATFPPFEYMSNNQFTGFDIELGQAIAEQMGLKVEIQSMNFDGLIPALQGKRIDMINSAMYIKPEREQQVDFVTYMGLGDSIVVKSGNPKGIKSLDDLSGNTVAVTRGAVEEINVREHNEKLKQAGKTEIKVLALPTANDAVLATEQGRADAFLHSSPGAAYLQEEKPGVFEIAGTFGSDTKIGIAVRKGDTEMKAAIEAALKNVVEDGTYKKLMDKYHLPEEMSYFK